MPDFIVEVHSKSIYGPFTYPSAAHLRADLVGGNLKMDEVATIIDQDTPTRISVKEVKPEK
jgi:hypothetical protein